MSRADGLLSLQALNLLDVSACFGDKLAHPRQHHPPVSLVDDNRPELIPGVISKRTELIEHIPMFGLCIARLAHLLKRACIDRCVPLRTNLESAIPNS